MRLPLAALLLLAACSSSDTTTANERATAPLKPTVRDSAGIQIAEHPADAFDRAPLITMDTVPLYEFGGEDAEIETSRASRPLVLRDGRLAIFADGTIYIIGSDGTVVERIGRSGSGPGEFRMASLTFGRGDTLLAEDGVNARIAYVVPGSGVIRERRIPGFRSRTMMMAAGGLGGDTTIVQTAGFALPDNLTGPTTLPWITGRFDPGSDSAVRVDSVDGPVLVPSGDGAQVRAYDGVLSTTVTHDAVVTTTGRTWLLRVVRPDGALVRLIRVLVPRRVPDPTMVAADADSQIARFREMMAQGRWPEEPDTVKFFESFRRIPIADSLGALGAVLRSPDDVLWVRDGGYQYSDTTWAYTALRPDGTILGRLEGAGRNRITAFGPGVAVLREEDDNGFVMLRVHRLNGLR